MSATDNLRSMLDERHVKWRTDISVTNKVEWTIWNSPWFKEVWAKEVDGSISIFSCLMTPAQAIEATLGRGECHVEPVQQDCNMTRYGWVCDRCHGLTIGFAAPHFCSVCGRAVRA